MGIDPGLNATGYGIIIAAQDRMEVVATGVIRPPGHQPLARRLQYLYDELTRVIEAYQPKTMVLEILYTHHRYLTTASSMAHARGIICLISAQHGLAFVDYAPTRVRKALSGYGSASKEQVAHVVGARLGVQDPSWSSDVTDALALAITHAQVVSINFASQNLFTGHKAPKRDGRNREPRPPAPHSKGRAGALPVGECPVAPKARRAPLGQ